MVRPFGRGAAGPSTVPDHGTTATGLDANLAAALTYALGWVSGVLFYVLEPDNKFVRFHALQSIIVFGGLSVAWMIVMAMPPVGFFVAFLLIPPLSAVLWLLLMFKAYHGERFKLPGVGDLVEPRV